MNFEQIKAQWLDADHAAIRLTDRDAIMKRLKKITSNLVRIRIWSIIKGIIAGLTGGILIVMAILEPQSKAGEIVPISIFLLMISTGTLLSIFQQIKREQRFGDSVREKTARGLSQINHRIRHLKFVTRWVLPSGILLWGAYVSYFWIAGTSTGPVPSWFPIYVFSCTLYFIGVWQFYRRSIQKKLEPNRQILGDMLQSLDEG